MQALQRKFFISILERSTLKKPKVVYVLIFFSQLFKKNSSKLLSVVGLFNFLNFFQNKASFWAIAGLLYINKFDLFVDIASKDVMKYTLDTELVLT